MKYTKMVGGVLVICMILLVIAHAVHALCEEPRQIELPKAMPLVLDFNTGLDIDQTVTLLSSRYSVTNGNVSVEVCENESLSYKRIPLVQMVRVENVVMPGLSKREVRCFFVRNRLREVQFMPRLTEEECKRLSLNAAVFETPEQMIDEREWDYFKGSCGGEDRLLLVDYGWGSSVCSEKLWKAQHQLKLPGLYLQ